MKRPLLYTILLLAVSVGVVLFSPIHKVLASADFIASQSNLTQPPAQYNWVDMSHISASEGGQTISFISTNGVYQWVNKSSGNNFLSLNNQCNGGSSVIHANQSSPNDKGSVTWYFAQSLNSPCSTYPANNGNTPITIGSPQNADIMYHWNPTSSQIERVDNGNYAYVRDSGNPNVYIKKDSSPPCADEIVINIDGSADMWLLSQNQDITGSGKKVTDKNTDAVGCYANTTSSDYDQVGNDTKANGTTGAIPIHVIGVGYETTNGNGSITCSNGDVKPTLNDCSGAGATGASATTATSCDQSSFALSWVFCPFISELQKGVAAANSEIQSLLTLPVDAYFNEGCVSAVTSGSNSPTPTKNCTTSATNYRVWSNMRDIALSLLVIAALIMVIATALDIGPLDAYTVKKVLPRVLIAVIAITFSWEVGRLLVTFSNDIGDGIGQLILSAVPISLPAGTPVTNAAILTTISTGVLGWLGAGAAVGAVGLATIGPLALFMLLLPAIIAFALGFIVLIGRQLIVVICIIFAPLALISFVLPGSQKLFKFWQQSFVGALFLFPLITAVIAIGAVMAFLVNSGDVTNYVGVAPLLALILLIAPYFLIPRLFRLSGGALGTIANGVNSASQGLFKAARQAQRNKMASSWQKAKQGDLYHGYSWLPGSQRLSQRVSAVTRGVGTGWSGHYGVGERGKQAIHKSDNSSVEEYQRSPENAAFKDYDDAQRAKTYANATEAARGLREDWGLTDEHAIHQAVEAARVSGGFGGYQAIAAARNLGMSTTAYKTSYNPDGSVKQSALEQSIETNMRVSRGNGGISAGLAAFTSAASKAQRPDISPGAEASIALAQRRMREGKLGQEVYAEHLDKAFEGAGSVQQMMAYAKKPAVESFMKRQKYLIAHGDQKQRGEAAIRLSEMYNNLSSAGGDQRHAVLEGFNDMGIDIRGEGVSVSSQLVGRATDESSGAAGIINGHTLSETNLAASTRTWGNEQTAAQGMQPKPPEGEGADGGDH